MRISLGSWVVLSLAGLSALTTPVVVCMVTFRPVGPYDVDVVYDMQRHAALIGLAFCLVLAALPAGILAYRKQRTADRVAFVIAVMGSLVNAAAGAWAWIS